MKEEELKKLLNEEYDLKVLSIEKIKNVYKVVEENEEFCLKVIKYEYAHFNFILSAINHLQKNNFDRVPDIISTVNGKQYIHIESGFAYLTKWILGRESNYDNPIELEKVTKKLAELHIASEGFNLQNKMKPRIGWFSWIRTFKTRRNEIIDFKNRINQKFYKNQFDKLYLGYVEEEVNRANKAIEGLENSNYIQYMGKEVFRRGFCHHDYANHNILIDKNFELNVIDFDYCILDTSLHDLSSLMIRVMKNRKWDLEKANKIINYYTSINILLDGYKEIMKEFIRFPQSFWQIGLQKYWEQQPWDEELFLNKISKYVEDRNDREEFLEEFFS